MRAIARDLTLQPGVPLIVEHDARCVGRPHRGHAVAGASSRVDAPRVARWHAPVALAVLGGGSAQAVIDGADAAARDGAGLRAGW